MAEDAAPLGPTTMVERALAPDLARSVLCAPLPAA